MKRPESKSKIWENVEIFIGGKKLEGVKPLVYTRGRSPRKIKKTSKKNYIVMATLNEKVFKMHLAEQIEKYYEKLPIMSKVLKKGKYAAKKGVVPSRISHLVKSGKLKTKVVAGYEYVVDCASNDALFLNPKNRII
jgi:hypothetical protein